MNDYPKLTKAALICNMLIIIGFGHGIAPIVLFEFIMPFHRHDIPWSFAFKSSYEPGLFAAAVFSFFGQMLLLASITTGASLLKPPGIILLWIGFAYLTHNFFTNDDVGSAIGFYTGLPFLILSAILFTLQAKCILKNKIFSLR